MADKPYVLNKLENAVYHDGDTAKDFNGNTLEFGKQPDWNQTDTTALDYVKNKPTLDTDIVSGSTNAVTGDTLYKALAEKANIIDCFDTTLAAASWSDKTYTVSVLTLAADDDMVVGLAQTATEEQAEACRSAMIRASAQAEGSFTMTADGDIPAIDIPIAVMIMHKNSIIEDKLKEV